MTHEIAALEGSAKTVRADMWEAVCDDAVEEEGIVLRRFGPVQANVFRSLPDVPLLNTILGAGDAGAVSGGHLGEAIEWADSTGVDYRVPIAPQLPEGRAAEALLDHHGFEQGHGIVRFVHNAAAPHLPGVPGVRVWEISEEEGKEGAAAETMVFSAGPAIGMPSISSVLLFGLPSNRRWRTYTAELDGRIVAYGSMLVHGEIAVIALDGTAEEAQGRGCNQALLRQRLIDARLAGCRTVFADVFERADGVTSPIVRNLVRAGFVPTFRSVCWQRARVSAAASHSFGY